MDPVVEVSTDDRIRTFLTVMPRLLRAERPPAAALLEDFRGFLEIRYHGWKNASLADAASMVCYAGLQRFLAR